MTKIFFVLRSLRWEPPGQIALVECRYSDLDAFPEFVKHIPTRRNVVFTKLASFQHFSRATEPQAAPCVKPPSALALSVICQCFLSQWAVHPSCACSARTVPNTAGCWASNKHREVSADVKVSCPATSIPSTLSLMSARLSAFPASSFACNKIPKTSCSSEVVVGAGRSLHQSGLEAAPAHELHEQTLLPGKEQESTEAHRSRFHTPFPTVHPQQCNPHK